MFDSIFAATVLAVISTLLFKADFAISPLLGCVFALTACAALAQGLETSDEESKAEEGDAVVLGPKDLHRNVHFSGRTGSDLVDPRNRDLSDAELELVIQNAQKALRKKGKSINSITARRV